MHTYVPCNKQCNSCTNFVVAKVRSCSIVKHFIDVCSDTDDPSKVFRFIIIDQLNNTNNVSPDEIDDL